MDFETFALVAIMALFACFFVWLMWLRYAPLRLAFDEPASATFGREIREPSGLGKVGELVTALMLAKDGWQQLPSRAAGSGLDGVFVRKVAGRQFEVRLVETKCAREGDPKSAYDAQKMADDTVIEQLEQLKGVSGGDVYIDEQAIESIVKAIRRGSMHVSKQFYAHALDAGHTFIYSVRSDGALIDRPAKVKRVTDAPHRLMVQALATGLARLGEPAEAAASSGAADA